MLPSLQWVSGLIDLPWWGYAVLTLVLTHITIASVTIFLHRAQAHRALDLHPIASHFFRFWLWMTTGMVTREWVAIHRKHHAKVETPDDPHSPQTRGLKTVFWQGAELYRGAARSMRETKVEHRGVLVSELERYSDGVPDDWIERNLYTRFSWQGVGLMLVVNLVLFGPIGLTIWAVQMLWIPVTAAGIINGIGHYWGYRNFECEDASTNIVPWGILIGGEELHNNHHAYGTSAKLSNQWYEFDIGWLYIRVLEACKLATVNKLPPEFELVPKKDIPDLATLQAVIALRYEVLKAYLKAKKAALKAERKALRKQYRDPESLDEALLESPVFQKLHALQTELQAIWARSTESREQLLLRLQGWCQQAYESRIPMVSKFEHWLRRLKLRST